MCQRVIFSLTSYEFNDTFCSIYKYLLRRIISVFIHYVLLLKKKHCFCAGDTNMISNDLLNSLTTVGQCIVCCLTPPVLGLSASAVCVQIS